MSRGGSFVTSRPGDPMSLALPVPLGAPSSYPAPATPVGTVAYGAPAAPVGTVAYGAPAPVTEHDPLPLPVSSWGAAQALDALAEARLALPMPLRRPRVVSALTTVVLRAGHHAVKVYPPGTDAEHLARIGEALAE